MSIHEVDSGSFLRVLDGLVLGLTGIYAINGLWHLHCWLNYMSHVQGTLVMLRCHAFWPS